MDTKDIFTTPTFNSFEVHRNFSVASDTKEWVLFLCSNEYVIIYSLHSMEVIIISRQSMELTT